MLETLQTLTQIQYADGWANIITLGIILILLGILAVVSQLQGWLNALDAALFALFIFIVIGAVELPRMIQQVIAPEACALAEMKRVELKEAKTQVQK